jgi:hypothetical protein
MCMVSGRVPRATSQSGRERANAVAGRHWSTWWASVVLLWAFCKPRSWRSCIGAQQRGSRGSDQTGVAGGAARTGVGRPSAVGVEGGWVGRTVAAEGE